MTTIGWQIFFIFLLMLANGVFAMAEIALVSARKARLQQWGNEGNKKALVALELANSPARFLSAIQIAVTVNGTLAGALAGATLTENVKVYVDAIPLLQHYSYVISMLLVVLGITYLEVTIGALVPKNIALNNAEKIAINLAPLIKVWAKIIHPFVVFLGFSTKVMLTILGSKPSQEPPVTGEEINVMIAQGTEAGVFEESQQDMVENVIGLNEKRIRSLMTPRPDIIWLDLDDPLTEIQTKIATHPYSRYPVGRNSLDEILGFVHVKDLFGDCIAGKEFNLKLHVKKALSIPETIPVLKSLDSFKQAGVQFALVIDEYGGLQGLVTLSDILENLVGEITSHGQPTDPEAIQRDDGSWLIDGMQSIDDFKELMDIQKLPDEDENHYQTLGGFVMTRLGKIPKAGDKFTSEGFLFEVMDMDGHRVDKVLASVAP